MYSIIYMYSIKLVNTIKKHWSQRDDGKSHDEFYEDTV